MKTGGYASGQWLLLFLTALPAISTVSLRVKGTSYRSLHWTHLPEVSVLLLLLLLFHWAWLRINKIHNAQLMVTCSGIIADKDAVAGISVATLGRVLFWLQVSYPWHGYLF